MTDAMFDVAVAGMGPAGLAAAALLARLGRRVLIVDKFPALYGLPRAGHIDHEIVRILESIGAAAPVLSAAAAITEYAWRNCEGELLIEFKPSAETVSGYHSDYMMYQPVLEDAMVAAIRDESLVQSLRGWELVGFSQDPDGVDICLRAVAKVPGPARPGDEKNLRAAYLIAADGAGSFVRSALGIERDDMGFNEDWLDVDAKIKRPLRLETECGHICDPRRPRVSLPLGKYHHRWEWSLRQGETWAEMERSERAWQLLAVEGCGPDDLDIVRQIVYRFEARIAKQWRVGRVLLAGDAAHTMPPFMGQGLCSGVRDVSNLSWKLALVLDGIAREELLDTYQAERYAHVHDWTILSIRSGEVSCVLDEQKAAERDALFRSGFVPPMPEFPYLRTGVVGREGAAEAPLAGRLALNARVRRRGVAKLFDALFYRHGWILLSVAADAALALAPRQNQLLKSIHATRVCLGTEECEGDGVDLHGRYARWFRDHHIDLVLIRPDFYVFGGAPRERIGAMIDQLYSLLHIVENPDGPARVRGELLANEP